MVPSPRTGRPPRIDRDAVVAGARAIVVAEGVEALTMRRLARELGVGPMTLYHHVRDKDDLLVLVLDRLIDDVALPAPDRDPRRRIVQYARALREILDAHPWVIEVIAPGDRFARRALDAAEVIAAAFVELGLDPVAATIAYRAVWFETLGELVHRHGRERRARSGDLSPVGERLLAELDPARTPVLAAGHAARAGERFDPDAAIAALVDGLVAAVG